MFERFTDRARLVVARAQEEARMRNHDYIGTEHILLGLVHQGKGVAAQVLESSDISLEAVRSGVEEIVGPGQQAPSGHIPFTPGAKKVLELSLREALQLSRHGPITTGHILLALIREGEGVGARVLAAVGADLALLRREVSQLGAVSEAAEREPERAVPLSELQDRLSRAEARLAAREHRADAPLDARDLDERLDEVRRQKESAIDVQDWERASAWRDQERDLLTRREIERLRALIRQHGNEHED